MADLGGYTSVKRIYASPVAALSDVPEGLTSGDLVAVAAQAGGIGTGHVHNGIYKVQAGAWEKLAPNASTRYQIAVGVASSTGGNPVTDGLYVLRCNDVSAGKYIFTRMG